LKKKRKIKKPRKKHVYKKEKTDAAEKVKRDKEAADKAKLEKEKSDKTKQEKEASDKAKIDKEKAEAELELERHYKEQQELDEKNADLERQRLEEDRKRRIEEAKKRSAEVRAQRSAEDRKLHSGYAAVMIISFRAVNKHGQSKKKGGDAALFTAFGNNHPILRIEDHHNGTYSFEYQCVPGHNTIDVKSRGQSIKGFPVSFMRKSESELSRERAASEAIKVRDEEDRLKEEEKIREEVTRELEQEVKIKEVQRKQREEERTRDYLIAREQERKRIEEKKRESESINTQLSSDIEERKRKILEKKKEINRLKMAAVAATADKDNNPPQPASDQPLISPRGKLWQSDMFEAKNEEPKKEPISPRRNTNPSKKAPAVSMWEQKINEQEPKPGVKTTPLVPRTGNPVASKWPHAEEEKPKETKEQSEPSKDGIVTRSRALSSKVAAWETRQSSEPSEGEQAKPPAQTKPAGTGKVSALWEQKLTQPEDQPKPGKAPPRDPNKVALGAVWESTVLAQPQDKPQPTMMKDIEQLKSLMAKERQITIQFSVKSQQILFNFINSAKVYEKKLDTENLSSFDKLSDGVIIALFFKKHFPKYFGNQEIKTHIRERQDRADNFSLIFQACQSAGISNPDISIDMLLEGEFQQIGMLLWDIVKLILSDEVKSQSDYLKFIFKGTEYTTWDLDTILLNWVNKILSQGGYSRTVSNITEDFKDSFVYLTMMDIILETGTAILSNEDLSVRAKEVVISSALLERESITDEGILQGIYWQNVTLLCSLLITGSALCPLE